MKQSINTKFLSQDFYRSDTKDVAKNLLGKILYRQDGQNLYRAIITETEAYHGESDLACHCSKGKTPRTSVMYDEPGCIYVYLIYGMYHMLNFVTMPAGFPAAVLVRGVSYLQVSENGQAFKNVSVKTDGPGKLTKHLNIDKQFNRLKLHPDTGLWVADEGIKISEHQILSTKRVGVDYAKEWADKLWRYKLHPDIKLS